MRSKKKTAKKKLLSSGEAHPWRPCPLGQHWVTGHTKNRISSLGKPFVQTVAGFCRDNPSHQDHLYADEIHEIAKRQFSDLSGSPAIDDFKYKSEGNRYDSFIRGWTRYWNEVLKPEELLDPNIVKALIATESSFDPMQWNHRRGKNSARGLMQVINESVQLLKNPKELSDHFVSLDENDMTDPNLNICAGIRWLFRKKQLAEAKSKQPLSWREAIAAYKGVKPDEKRLMPRFDDYLQQLRRQK